MAISYPKDILIIDFESSNSDIEKTKPLQIGAILLDRETLEEKRSFVSYINVDLSDVATERLEKKEIKPEDLINAPTSSEVARRFIETFGKDFLLASWAANLDMTLFRKLMLSAGIPWSDFDYHIYDLWPVAYTYLLKRGYVGSIRSEPIFQEFGLPSRGAHDALEDCRHAAEILRKIVV